MSILFTVIVVVVAYGAVRLVQQARRQRRPTPPRPAVTPAMQQKMARSLTTLIAAGGMNKLAQANTMAKGYGLRRSNFEQLAVPPEEDFARENLMRLARS